MGVYLYTPYSRTPWANTLAYYPLAEDCNDYSGNNRHGTNSNVTFSNWLATFNGSSSKITIAHAAWNKIQTNMTIQAWYNYTWADDGYWVIISKTQMNPYYQSDMYWFMSCASWWSAVAGWFAPWNTWYFKPIWQWEATGSYGRGWHLLTLTNDWSTKTLYCDGTLVSTVSLGSTSSNHSIQVVIWNRQYRTANNRFTGNISKVILENKTWTQQEILDFYNWTKSDLPTT